MHGGGEIAPGNYVCWNTLGRIMRLLVNLLRFFKLCWEILISSHFHNLRTRMSEIGRSESYKEGLNCAEVIPVQSHSHSRNSLVEDSCTEENCRDITKNFEIQRSESFAEGLNCVENVSHPSHCSRNSLIGVLCNESPKSLGGDTNCVGAVSDQNCSYSRTLLVEDLCVERTCPDFPQTTEIRKNQSFEEGLNCIETISDHSSSCSREPPIHAFGNERLYQHPTQTSEIIQDESFEGVLTCVETVTDRNYSLVEEESGDERPSQDFSQASETLRKDEPFVVALTCEETVSDQSHDSSRNSFVEDICNESLCREYTRVYKITNSKSSRDGVYCVEAFPDPSRFFSRNSLVEGVCTERINRDFPQKLGVRRSQSFSEGLNYIGLYSDQNSFCSRNSLLHEFGNEKPCPGSTLALEIRDESLEGVLTCVETVTDRNYSRDPLVEEESGDERPSQDFSQASETLRKDKSFVVALTCDETVSDQSHDSSRNSCVEDICNERLCREYTCMSKITNSKSLRDGVNCVDAFPEPSHSFSRNSLVEGVCTERICRDFPQMLEVRRSQSFTEGLNYIELDSDQNSFCSRNSLLHAFGNVKPCPGSTLALEIRDESFEGVLTCVETVTDRNYSRDPLAEEESGDERPSQDFSQASETLRKDEPFVVALACEETVSDQSHDSSRNSCVEDICNERFCREYTRVSKITKSKSLRDGVNCVDAFPEPSHSFSRNSLVEGVCTERTCRDFPQKLEVRRSQSFTEGLNYIELDSDQSSFCSRNSLLYAFGNEKPCPGSTLTLERQDESLEGVLSCVETVADQNYSRDSFVEEESGDERPSQEFSKASETRTKHGTFGDVLMCRETVSDHSRSCSRGSLAEGPCQPCTHVFKIRKSKSLGEGINCVETVPNQNHSFPWTTLVDGMPFHGCIQTSKIRRSQSLGRCFICVQTFPDRRCTCFRKSNTNGNDGSFQNFTQVSEIRKSESFGGCLDCAGRDDRSMRYSCSRDPLSEAFVHGRPSQDCPLMSEIRRSKSFGGSLNRVENVQCQIGTSFRNRFVEDCAQTVTDTQANQALWGIKCSEQIESKIFYNSRTPREQHNEEDWRLYYGAQIPGTEICQSSDEDSNDAKTIQSQTFYRSRMPNEKEVENVYRLHYRSGTPNLERYKQWDVARNPVIAKEIQDQACRKSGSCETILKGNRRSRVTNGENGRERPDENKMENSKESNVLQQTKHQVYGDSKKHSMLSHQKECDKLNKCYKEETNPSSSSLHDKAMSNKNTYESVSLALKSQSDHESRAVAKRSPAVVSDSIGDGQTSGTHRKMANVSECCERQIISQMSGIKVCLRFQRLFQNDSLQEILEEKFYDFAGLSLSYTETHMLCKRDETVCRFSVYATNPYLAIKGLKKVVKKLKKELDISLTYEIIKRFARGKENADSGAPTSSKLTQSLKDETCKERENAKRHTTPDHHPFEFNSEEQKAFLQTQIHKASNDVNRKMLEFLQRHDKKVDEMQSRIAAPVLRESGTDLSCEANVENKNILQQKLEELKLQRSEFVQSFKKLFEDLKSLDHSTAKQEDVVHLLKAIGIECTRLKNALPIYARRKDIVEHVLSHQVSIILGETGSGKSTQLIQYLYEAGFARHESIICTQPRRIAAITLAERVANEMVESAGTLVGYKSGTCKKSSENTKLFFTTDHSLLNECLNDPELKNYSCIIVDEAHERSIYTDILLGIIKTCLHKRPDLKVIITSATIDPEVFITYFNSGPELRVSGRTFPVDLVYSDDGRDDFENYEEKAVSKAVEVHNKEGPGDILVFLTSPVEIMRCCEEFEKRCHPKTNFKCLPLHGQLPSEEQKEVFETLPAGKRKIVFATNCAETSITIDGIKYVIDTGVAKEMKYDPKRNMNQLRVHAISKSSANQRKGRAGRTARGKCFRLYSQEGFQAMESINDPEILRVHLGQAVLKLSEFGVNIRSYDFVQAPSETALRSAIETLEYLDAIVDNKITDIGRWISKLPFDPKLGYVVYEANKNNLLFDAIVLAAVISSGSDLFFRGFTESESQVVAKTKVFFGSEYGDTFTWLQVYKEWSEAHENERAWCRSRCINYKCIKYVNQYIKDTTIILSRDLGIDLIQQFSTETRARDKLRKILFIANAHSISNFSERVRAGYYSIFSDRQVHLHPSSVLVALNVYPEWLVYTHLVETSRPFIKGVTSVEEEWVLELTNSGKIYIDVQKARKNKFYRQYREEMGKTVFNSVVGPQFSNLQILEHELSECGLPKLTVEAMRDMGCVDVYSPFPVSQSAIEKFEKLKRPKIEELLVEDCDFNLNKKEAMVTSGTCVVIGRGGCVKNIFMPNQSDKVVIKRIYAKVTAEKISRKFGEFGEIKEMVPFKSFDPWGFIRYGSVEEAVKAVEETKADKFCAGALKLPNRSKNFKNMFEAKLIWTRRPIKGSGTAFIDCPHRYKISLLGRSIRTSGDYLEIKESDRGGLIIFDTGSLTEDDITALLTKNFHLRETDLRVSVSRESVPLEDPGDIRRKAHRITSFIKNYLSEDTFEVRMLTPNERSFDYVCFLSFTDILKGIRVCNKIERHLDIDVSPELKTIVRVPGRLKKACGEGFEKLFKSLEKNRNTSVSWFELKGEEYIEILSSNPSNIVMARHLLCKLMEGDIIDCSDSEHLKCLLNEVGQDRLKKIETDNECIIVTDFRSSTIHLYGSETKIIRSKQDINFFLKQIKGSEQKLIHLKGHDKPPGFMKAIMQKYGHLLNDLRTEFDLKSTNVDWRRHTIELIGAKGNVEKASCCLSALETEIRKKLRLEKKDVLDCVVCMCPIENTEHLYRLEVCGHAYCFYCMKYQVLFSVSNKDFPITCAGEGCLSPYFVWRDITFALSKMWISNEKLVSMSVNHFVLGNRTKYKFCLSPNCPVVYEVTDDQKGCEFNCPLCHVSICTTCHTTFHAGLSCTMAKHGARVDSSLSAWNFADGNDRKFCPECHCPIEKTGGCNSMQCDLCKTFFCWCCLKVCSSKFACKNHIRQVHRVCKEVRV